MRFLVDKNISRRLGPLLAAAGHDAVHVDDLDLGAAPDDVILARAAAEGRVVVSADTDFGALLAAGGDAKPSVILTREISTMPARDLAALLLANLDDLAPALDAGAVIALGRRSARIRRLPLR